MKIKTIKQSIVIKAEPHDVYELILDSKKHSKLTGAPAIIGRNIGEKFSIWDGEIEGINLELFPDQKITQSWRYSNWPENYFSKVTFAFSKVPAGTNLIFTQTGVPEEHYVDIAQGWKDYYWKPMKKMFEKKSRKST